MPIQISGVSEQDLDVFDTWKELMKTSLRLQHFVS